MTEEERETADAWLTLAEIAGELRVNPATVRQWVSKGQLKASRAGVRKWIVRRSDLERMLSATRPPAEPDEPVEDERTADEPRSARPGPPTADAIALYQIAGRAYQTAFDASAYAPPSPGYLKRVRAMADACEHLSSTMTNASKVAGVQWSPRSGFRAEDFPYELRQGGNRPGPDELWQDFDAALERLAIAASGIDVPAVAHAFRDVGETLLDVADELERDDSWNAGSRAG